MALSSNVIMTIVLGREKMMQLMAWIRYNKIILVRLLTVNMNRAVNPPSHQILRIDWEGMIDDIISHNK